MFLKPSNIFKIGELRFVLGVEWFPAMIMNGMLKESIILNFSSAKVIARFDGLER
jgi:hypothetical protein